MSTASSARANLLLLSRPAAALRLILAGLLLVGGRGMGLGQAAPSLFWWVAVGYLAVAVGLAVWPARAASPLSLAVVAACADALFFGLFLVASGGFASGLPTLLFVQTVVAAFEAPPRFALFHAAMAVVVLLGENLWRLWRGAGGVDPFFVGLAGAALFVAAFLAQQLGERLRRSEAARAAQEALLARHERLAALGLLLAGVAHEVRNPLAGIAQALDLLADATDEVERQALVALAQRNAARIAQMVDEVLVLGRQNPPQPQAVALRGWFAAWRAELPAPDAERVALTEGPEVTAWVDPSHWRTIVENLVLNAFAFASEQPGAVAIAVAEAGERVAVTVADDGPGVAAEVEDRLFEPFVSARPEGTGLGLYLVHELVRANGGEVRYKRAPAGGAAFTVFLPRPPR